MISGPVGTGKTRYGLTAPDPLFALSFDKGLEGVVEEFVEAGKRIQVADYDWHPGTEDFSQAYAQQLRDQVIRDYEYALANARSILVDKETDLWELFRYAEFGRPNESPKDYVKLNQRYKAFINAAKKTDVNLVLIDSMKDDWGTVGAINSTTGKRSLTKIGTQSRRGFDALDELVYVETEFAREPSTDPEAPGAVFYIDVKKCRQNSALQEQRFESMTFSEFGTLLIPGSSIEDWS